MGFSAFAATLPVPQKYIHGPLRPLCFDTLSVSAPHPNPAACQRNVRLSIVASAFNHIWLFQRLLPQSLQPTLTIRQVITPLIHRHLLPPLPLHRHILQ